MVKHLTSKIAVTIYIIIAIALAIWGYIVFQQRDGKVPTPAPAQTFSNDSSSSIASTDDLSNDGDKDNASANANQPDAISPSVSNPTDNSAPAPADNDSTVSAIPNVSGSMLAHITPEHCDTDCKAFSSDLSLFEYCQQVCGISPIKNVKNCDDKKDLQKDYCQKDLAITKEDASLCVPIKDANIKQTCQNRIAQDAIENVPNSTPLTQPPF